MLEAIKLGVSHYVMKPVVLDNLLEQLEDVCSRKFQIQKFINKEKELQEYINIINNVAIVSTTDTRGIITYVNDIFCKTSGYEESELIGKPHNIIRHPETPKEVFENMWNTIKKGLTWNGKIKNIAKDGTTYYVDANIFPLFYEDNQTIKGYMGVRFLTTDIEIEKRQFKQKVVQNLIKQKSIICAYESTISNLNEENKLLNNKVMQFENMDLFFDKLAKEKQKNVRLLSQLDAYEKQFEGIITKNQEIAIKAKQSEQKSLEELKSIKVKYESSKFTMTNQAKEIEKKEKVIYTLQERIDEYLKTIENLQDVIKFKEKEQREQIHKDSSSQNQEVTNL
jgi:PAS domain S-box-containing protein